MHLTNTHVHMYMYTDWTDTSGTVLKPLQVDLNLQKSIIPDDTRLPGLDLFLPPFVLFSLCFSVSVSFPLSSYIPLSISLLPSLFFIFLKSTLCYIIFILNMCSLKVNCNMTSGIGVALTVERIKDALILIQNFPFPQLSAGNESLTASEDYGGFDEPLAMTTSAIIQTAELVKAPTKRQSESSEFLILCVCVCIHLDGF